MTEAPNRPAFFHMLDKRLAFAHAVVAHAGLAQMVHDSDHADDKLIALCKQLKELTFTTEDEYTIAREAFAMLSRDSDHQKLDG